MTGRWPFSTEIRVRLPETDAFGIVFHGYYFTYFDVARMDYLRNINALDFISPAHGCTNVIAQSGADFVSPARFDDVLVVSARITEIGRTSFRFEFEVNHKSANRLTARGKSVHVVLDKGKWKPVPVPEDFRKLVRGFEGPDLKEKEA
jgi:acyl-CoA thioester hydrolase